MDPVTHGLLGAACAQVCLHKKLKKAWVAGALAAMAPDLDLLIHSAQDPLVILLYHRQFTHSLIFIPIGALIVTAFFMLFKTFRAQWQYTFLAALIGFSTHGLLDTLNNYGTVLFWPFSYQRVALDTVSIVDLFVTIPLLLGFVWTLVHEQRRGILLSFAFILCFFIFNAFQHNRALTYLENYAKQQALDMNKMRVFPQFMRSTYWRGLGKVGDKLYIFDIKIPLFRKGNLSLIKIYPAFSVNKTPDYVKNSPTFSKDLKNFSWFTNDYLVLIKENPLTLGDARFLIDNQASITLWAMVFLKNKPYPTMSSYFIKDS